MRNADYGSSHDYSMGSEDVISGPLVRLAPRLCPRSSRRRALFRRRHTALCVDSCGWGGASVLLA
eukprot:722118-Alexandrium_andersonii.AAC.1